MLVAVLNPCETFENALPSGLDEDTYSFHGLPSLYDPKRGSCKIKLHLLISTSSPQCSMALCLKSQSATQRTPSRIMCMGYAEAATGTQPLFNI